MNRSNITNATPKPAAKKVTLPAPLTGAQKMEALGIHAICERMSQGESQRSIADSISVHRGEFSDWLAATPERSARAREARALSARYWDDQAEKVLLGADDDKPGSIAKARELASHYRWRAKCYAPREYGDKIGVEHGGTVNGIG